MAWWGLISLTVLLGPALVIIWAWSEAGSIRFGRTRAAAEKRINAQLDRLERFQDRGYFFHRLLSDILLRAERSPNPRRSLKRDLAWLRRTFGNAFQFVVWNEGGSLDQELTTVTGFRFVLGKVREALLEVKQGMLAAEPRLPATIPSVVAQEKLLQNVFGPNLILDHLARPYQRNHPSPLAFVRQDPQATYVWHRLGRRYGLAVLIGRPALDHPASTDLILRRANAAPGQGFAVGLAETPGFAFHPIPFHPMELDQSIFRFYPRWKQMRLRFPGSEPPPAAEIRRAIGQLERGFRSTSETPHRFYVLRWLKPGLVAFGLADSRRLRDSSLLSLLLVLVLQILLAFPLLSTTWKVLVGNQALKLSIRWKVTGLFLLATGLPLTSFALWGAEYLRQKEGALIDQAVLRAEGILRNYDIGLEQRRSALEEAGRNLVERLSSHRPQGPLPPTMIEALLGKVRTLRPDELYLLSGKEGVIGTLAGPCREAAVHRTILPAMAGKNILQVVRQGFGGGIATEPQPTVGLAIFDAATLADGFTRGFNRLSPLKVHLDRRSQVFLGFPTPAGSRIPDLLLMIVWSQGNLIRQYLETSILTVNRNDLGMRIRAQSDTTPLALGPRVRGLPDQARFLASVANRRIIQAEQVWRRGRAWLVVGFPGSNLAGFTLAGILPMEGIQEALAAQRTRLLWFGAGLLILAFGIGQILAGQLLAPVASLRQAVRAIDRRDFSHRVPETAGDELGRLGGVFNSLLEGFQDLAMAQLIQNSLFPPSTWKRGSLALYGRSTAMFEVGGDYFDIFPLARNRLGVILGDVAGHGVPAALIMAMVKACLAEPDAPLEDPPALLERIHQLLTAFKSREYRKMMTIQFLILDGEGGQGRLCNAGHTPPLLTTGSPRRGCYLEGASMPVGVARATRFFQKEFTVGPGDSLLLYSDGFPEAHGPTGAPLGYPDFLEAGVGAFDSDPERFFGNLHQHHLEFRGPSEAEDDLTLIVVVRDSGEGPKSMPEQEGKT